MYFWRWAIWKAFEQNGKGPAVVAYITASSWLDGPGFLGLRQLARQMADDIWIIDLGGDNKGAVADENIFGIETPVAIAILSRARESDRDEPARIHYTRIEGSRSEKLTKLDLLTRSGTDWQAPASGWFAPLRPVSGGAAWYAHPALIDLIPWQQPGCMFEPHLADRPAPQDPEAALEDVRCDSPTHRIGPTRSSRPRPGGTSTRAWGAFPASWTNPSGPHLAPYPTMATVRLTCRRRSLTHVLPRRTARRFGPLSAPRRCSSSPHPTSALSNGPAASAFTGVPDKHAFRGAEGGKDVFPLYRDATGTPNSDPAARAVIGQRHREVDVSAPDPSHEDLFAYCYAVLSGTNYTDRFSEELNTPGPRVPLSADPGLFTEAAVHGRHLLWLHTYGERFRTPEASELVVDPSITWSPEPSRIAADTKDFRYDPATQSLHVANGVLRGVPPEVWDFQVSGMPVLKKWLGYRTAKGTGKAASSKSPLDQIRPSLWYPEWTNELRKVVHVLKESLSMMDTGAELLDRILAGPLITAEELPEPPNHLREVPKVASGAATEGTLPF